ncbi:MAG TPA: hypothetical protein VFK30_10690 [Anaerolineae bacterium]|nr:hypothetical protein [Anaerolineae bacterium]
MAKSKRASQPMNSPQQLDDAALEAWLAGVLDAQPSRRHPTDAQAQALRSMIDRMRTTLVPIQPSTSFVRELGYRLVDTAGRSQQSLLRRYRTAIVIGVAAAGSVASVVGMTVLLLRQKNRRSVRGA